MFKLLNFGGVMGYFYLSYTGVYPYYKDTVNFYSSLEDPLTHTIIFSPILIMTIPIVLPLYGCREIISGFRKPILEKQHKNLNEGESERSE